MKELVERAIETARPFSVSFVETRIVQQSIEFGSGNSLQEMKPMKMKILAVMALALSVAAGAMAEDQLI